MGTSRRQCPCTLVQIWESIPRLCRCPYSSPLAAMTRFVDPAALTCIILGSSQTKLFSTSRVQIISNHPILVMRVRSTQSHIGLHAMSRESSVIVSMDHQARRSATSYHLDTS